MCVVGFLFRFAFIIVSVLLSFIAFVDFLRLAFALVVVFVRSLTIHNYTLYLAQTGAASAAAATAAGAAATNAADVVVIAVFACSEVKIAQF